MDKRTIVVGSSDAVCSWDGQTDLSAPSVNGSAWCVQFEFQL